MEKDLRYPLGRLQIREESLTQEDRVVLIDDMEGAPERLRNAVAGLTGDRLGMSYRPEGWTVRQVVQHLGDSHLNGYLNFKRTLTEEQPTLTSYRQDEWVDLEDSKSGPIEPALALLDSLHRRWVLLLRSLSPDQFHRTFDHPRMKVRDLDFLLNLYAWHGRHHSAQIQSVALGGFSLAI